MRRESSCRENEPARTRFHLLGIDMKDGKHVVRRGTHFKCTAASPDLGRGTLAARTAVLTGPYKGLISWHDASQYTLWCVLSVSGSGMGEATAASRSASRSRSTASINLWFSSAVSQPFTLIRYSS